MTQDGFSDHTITSLFSGKIMIYEIKSLVFETSISPLYISIFFDASNMEPNIYTFDTNTIVNNIDSFLPTIILLLKQLLPAMKQ